MRCKRCSGSGRERGQPPRGVAAYARARVDACVDVPLWVVFTRSTLSRRAPRRRVLGASAPAAGAAATACPRRVRRGRVGSTPARASPWVGGGSQRGKGATSTRYERPGSPEATASGRRQQRRKEHTQLRWGSAALAIRCGGPARAETGAGDIFRARARLVPSRRTRAAGCGAGCD
jgi:hypothetical protein